MTLYFTVIIYDDLMSNLVTTGLKEEANNKAPKKYGSPTDFGDVFKKVPTSDTEQWGSFSLPLVCLHTVH
jgi:hypothetical protein